MSTAPDGEYIPRKEGEPRPEDPEAIQADQQSQVVTTDIQLSEKGEPPADSSAQEEEKPDSSHTVPGKGELKK